MTELDKIAADAQATATAEVTAAAAMATQAEAQAQGFLRRNVLAVAGISVALVLGAIALLMLVR